MKKALLIGINYTNTSYELQGCINDALHLSTILQTKYGFQENNISLLLDDNMHIVPNKKNITIITISKLINILYFSSILLLYLNS